MKLIYDHGMRNIYIYLYIYIYIYIHAKTASDDDIYCLSSSLISERRLEIILMGDIKL